jgi:hypothetical protein
MTVRNRSVFISAIASLAIACFGCGSSSSARLPFGALDDPPEGATIQSVAQIRGWALSEDGISRVAIYLDRTYLQDAILSGHRDDVAKVYPAFAAVRDMQFVAEFHADNIVPGAHEISARAISVKGATRDFPAHNITIAH